MDSISYAFMHQFVRDCVKGIGLSVCDVGSYDVNGTFKPLFTGHNYIGLDIMAGPNVDVVAKEMYSYPFDDCSFDIVISGSTLEHVKDTHKWITEVARITKHGGIICVVAPLSIALLHYHPYDCWRIMPEGMTFLMEEIAGLEMIYCKRSEPADDKEGLDLLGVKRRRGRGTKTIHTVGVGRKR
jgi:SAM-dependent methyltransferase